MHKDTRRPPFRSTRHRDAALADAYTRRMSRPHRTAHSRGPERYLATYPAGTWDIIVRDLKSFRPNQLLIGDHDGSSALLETTLPAERLVEIRYFTNAYLVVKRPEELDRRMLKGAHYSLSMLDNGRPVRMAEEDRRRIGGGIESTLGLLPDTHRSRNDFCLISRASGSRMLTLRLPRARFKRDKTAAGELRPELAHVLCLAAKLRAKHRVLDMFAGHGSIPLEATRGFGCRDVIAVDRSLEEDRREHPGIEWHRADARDLSFIADGSVDRVITDPPWGTYDAKIPDLSATYEAAFREISRVLRPDGIAVMLTGYDEATGCAQAASELRLTGSWPILVSGRKATIIRFHREH